MKKKGLFSRVFASTMALVMAVTSVQIADPIEARAADSNYVIQSMTVEELISGYGLIASGTISGSVHIHSNFLTMNYSETSNSGVKTECGATYEESYANRISENCNPQLATRAGDYLYLGDTYTVTKLNANQVMISGESSDGTTISNKIMERPLNIVSDSMLANTTNFNAYARFDGADGITAKLIAYNKALVGQNPTVYTNLTSNNGEVEVGSEDKTVNMKWEDFYNLKGSSGDIIFKFDDLENGSNRIVINLDTAGVSSIIFPRIKEKDATTETRAAEENFDKNYNRIVYNLYDSSENELQNTKNVEGMDDFAIGTLISPSATVKLTSNWDGVVIAENIIVSAEFHRIGAKGVKADGEKDKPVFEPYKGRVTIKKQDEAGNMLGGAIFGIYAEASCTTLLAQCETTASGVGTFYNVKVDNPGSQKYYVKEITPPPGYVLNANVYEVVTDGVSIASELPTPISNAENSITFSKVNQNSQPVSGAKIKITAVDSEEKRISMEKVNVSGANVVARKNKYSNGSAFIEYETANSDVVFYRLPAGDYVMQETATPNEYQTASDIVFSVGIDGKVKVNNIVHDKVVMVDKLKNTVSTPKRDVTFSKKAANGQNELPGATLKLERTAGSGDLSTLTVTGGKAGSVQRTATQITWISSNTAVLVKDLPEGSYKLTETAAPNGYKIATEITFDIDSSSKIVNVHSSASSQEQINQGMIVMEDAAFGGIHIRKIQGADNTLTDLSGATIKLYEGTYNGTVPSNVNAIFTWNSDGTTKTIANTLLKINTNYTLVETNVPAGYKVANNITFRLDENGDITNVNNQHASSNVSGRTLVMHDEKLPVEATFSKKAANGTTELPGATLQLVCTGSQDTNFFGATTKKSGSAAITTGVDGENHPYLQWTSASDQLVLSNLPVGTYSFRETGAPAGYVYATAMEFEVRADGKIYVNNQVSNSNEFIMVDEAIPSIKISKKEIGGTEEIVGAHFTLHEDTAQGTVVVTWDGIGTPKEINGSQLKVNKTYVLVEDMAPAGYQVSSNLSFKIDENGNVAEIATSAYNSQTGTITVFDAPFETQFSKVDKVNNGELPGATIQLICTDSTNEELFKYVSVKSGDAVIEKKVDTNGHPYIQWTSTSQKLVLNALPAGSYTMKETGAPSGYGYASDVSFVIKGDGKVYADAQSNTPINQSNLLVMEDYIAKTISVSKKAVNGTEELPGATLQIKNGNTVVCSWTSGSSAKTIVVTNDQTKLSQPYTLLADTEYTLVETQAPNGYAQIPESESIKFKVDDNGSITLTQANGHAAVSGDSKTLTMKDELLLAEATFSKKEVTNGPEIPGAVIQIFPANANAQLVNVEAVPVQGSNDNAVITKPTVNGKTCIQWTSTTESVTLTNLPVGVYTMKEAGAPKGYAYASEITFEIKDDLKVYINNQVKNDNTVLMLDEAIKNIKISKKEIVGGVPGADELPGAKLTLYEGTTSGIVIDSWTGALTPREILGSDLKTETTYVLVEDQAPNGYNLASNITFRINKSGNVEGVQTSAYDESGRVLTMFDAPFEATFSKQDTAKANTELPGATIRLIADSRTADFSKVSAVGPAITKTTTTDGNPCIQWTSTETALVLSKLPAGKYTMEETGAPQGYAYADSITFTLGEDGKITGYTDNKIVMKDEALPPLNISKVEIVGEETQGCQELPGASMVLYKVSGKQKSKVLSWTSTDTPYAIAASYFEEGVTYIIHEEAAPQGYLTASDITFTYGKNGTILNVTDAYKVDQDQRLIAMLDNAKMTGTYSFSKVTLGGREIYGAKMKVVPLEGQDLSKVQKLNGSGGKDVVITRDSITWTTNAKTLGLVAVPDGKYELIEVEAPTGYIVADPIVFEAKDGILTDGEKKVELKDLYDPNTTTVSVYSRYYNVATFDPNHEDIVQSNTPTADNTEFELRDENGEKVKVVNKIVKRREIAQGVEVTEVTFVIDTTDWKVGAPARTYTITESKKPTAKENGGYTADDGDMVTTYTITKKYTKEGNKQVVDYDRVWSNKYQTNVQYDETNPDNIPLYSHTKTLSGNATSETKTEVTASSANVTETPVAVTNVPERKSPKTGEDHFFTIILAEILAGFAVLAAVILVMSKKKKKY